MTDALTLSIISIVVTVLFGLWNLRITIQNHRMRKDEFLRQKRKDAISEFNLRPRFKIISHEINMENPGYVDENDDIDCLVSFIKEYKKENNKQNFKYEESLLNQQDWVNVKLKLKNVGKTEINNMYISWNSPKNTSLFDVKHSEYVHFIKFEALNYSVILDETIETNKEITIKINYHKNFVAASFISAEATLWLFDEYNNIWSQPLFVKEGKIYDSSMRTYKDFKDTADIDSALECFENPMLW